MAHRDRTRSRPAQTGSDTPGVSMLAGAAQARLQARHPDIRRALAALAAERRLTGNRSAKISVRVDPGVLAAAAARLGLAEGDVSDVVNASLAVAAAPDRFKAWWDDPGSRLPDDFGLAI